MDGNDALARYQTLRIQTASADELGLMLFEAALRETKECQRAIREKNWAATFTHGKLAQDIMAHFAETVNLDHPQGKTMQGLYLYCWKTIAFVQSSHVAEDLDPVMTVLQNLINGLRGYIGKKSKELDVGTGGGTTSVVATVNFSG